MKKYIKITPAQIKAIGQAADMLSAMIGTGSDFDKESAKIVKLIDRILKNNGLTRQFK